MNTKLLAEIIVVEFDVVFEMANFVSSVSLQVELLTSGDKIAFENSTTSLGI